MAVAPVVHLLITVGAIVWGGFLGRGDLPVSVMAVKYLVILAYLGFLVAAAAWICDRGAARLRGAADRRRAGRPRRRRPRVHVRGPPRQPGPVVGLVWTVSIGVVMSAVGGILVRHPSGRGVGAVLLGCGAVTALSLLLGGYGLAALQLGAPGATVTLLASESLWPLFVVPLVTLLPLLYPDGRLPGRRWRLVRPGSV